jgi:hypothetical protein
MHGWVGAALRLAPLLLPEPQLALAALEHG